MATYPFIIAKPKYFKFVTALNCTSDWLLFFVAKVDEADFLAISNTDGHNMNLQ